jgi:hypothetical protein
MKTRSGPGFTGEQEAVLYENPEAVDEVEAEFSGSADFFDLFHIGTANEGG